MRLYKAIKTAMTPIKDELTNFEEVLYASRAVKVNGNRPIPAIFVGALAEAVVFNTLGTYDRGAVVDAITAGFIRPKESLVESLAETKFILYQNYQGSYVIAHHLQADYYKAELARVALTVAPFESAADCVLEVVSQLRLHELMVSVHREGARPFQSDGTGGVVWCSVFLSKLLSSSVIICRSC